MAGRPGHQVVFATARVDDRKIPGVRKVLYQLGRTASANLHPYVRSSEEAVLYGQSAARTAVALRDRGFRPDAIVSHAGWGPGLFVKEVFPAAKQIALVEWYYRSSGANIGFLPDEPVEVDLMLGARTGNIPFLAELTIADWSLTPTEYQKAQLPTELQRRLSVIHDGVDTSYFLPKSTSRGLVLEDLEDSSDCLSLSIGPEAEIVTYTTRGMEPYRGFPQFLRAAKLLLDARPNVHLVIAGENRVVYGSKLPEGDSWKQRMLNELDFDRSRLHFVGALTYRDYRRVLQASDAHVYLTIPFVLSWSMLEALATGCIVIASATPPVQEVVSHGENGLLVDFFDHESLARQITEVLDRPGDFAGIRAAARRSIIDRYDIRQCIPARINLLKDLVAGNC